MIARLVRAVKESQEAQAVEREKLAKVAWEGERGRNRRTRGIIHEPDAGVAAVFLVLGIVAGLFCIGAGIYPVGLEAREPTIIESIAHGMGWYMIGKGILVGAALFAMGWSLGQRSIAERPAS